MNISRENGASCPCGSRTEVTVRILAGPIATAIAVMGAALAVGKLLPPEPTPPAKPHRVVTKKLEVIPVGESEQGKSEEADRGVSVFVEKKGAGK